MLLGMPVSLCPGIFRGIVDELLLDLEVDGADLLIEASLELGEDL